MQKILIFATEIIIDTVSTCITVYLGENLVILTYMQLTKPHYTLPDIVDINTATTT
jgi:hypothetical protein